MCQVRSLNRSRSKHGCLPKAGLRSLARDLRNGELNMASGIKGSRNRPKTPKHLRSASTKTFEDTTKEMRDRRHAETDAWAERERAKHAEKPADSTLGPLRATPERQSCVTS